ncbi:hypothetical protein OpiT1DRAFT_04488 [Opitutaceae bacterium TAV1]|nr:hypothetical protein OpiT1DRAFT_04488 [Opitutaceae bacterium TAV1]
MHRQRSATTLSARARPLPERLLAGALALLVFILGLVCVSPSVHSWLHEGGKQQARACPVSGQDDDGGCVVLAFAGGLTVPPGDVCAPALPLPVTVMAGKPREELRLSSPRYLHRPERGPPLRG